MDCAAAASELAAPSGYAALLLQQWDGRIKALSDMQHRYVEQGQYAEAIVARAQWQMLITCCNDLKQHIAEVSDGGSLTQNPKQANSRRSLD
jgi:hypothetical protein